MKSRRTWNWIACGKHPSVKDYFSIGSSDSLLNAFSDWVEKGYRMLNAKQNNSSNFYSWRFWLRGSKKDNIVCGVVRSSSDSIGRPYPLLIIGTGRLKGWNKCWDLLPFACEKTWSCIEYFSIKRFLDFKQMENEVRLIKSPRSDWSEFMEQRNKRFEFSSNDELLSNEFKNMKRNVDILAKKTEFFIKLNSALFNDPVVLIDLWHSFLKQRVKEIPNAIFMGGLLDDVYLSVFKRPLAPSDFVQLLEKCNK